jgi:signal transduction histidine kinase/putative methionine-R-sulfoxide reductase with GAF domain
MKDPELPQAVPATDAVGEAEPDVPPAAAAAASPAAEGRGRTVPSESEGLPRLVVADAEPGAAPGLEAVARITEAVMRTAGLQDVLAGIVEGVRRELRSDTATLLLIEDDVLRVQAASGVRPEDAAAVAVPFGAGFAGRIAATRQPLVLPDVAPDQVHSAYLRDGIRALLGVPLLGDGELVGVLHVGWRHSRTPSADEQAFLELVGAPAAAAILRARLYEAERAGRAAAEEATERLRRAAATAQTLERVSTLLSSSLDYEHTLEHVSEAVVPALAEFCQIYVRAGDQIRRVAVACERSDKRAVLDAVNRRPALGLRGPSPQAAVLASGKARMINGADEEFYRKAAEDEEHRALLSELGVRGLIIAPMRTPAGVTGALLAGRFDATRPFTREDLGLLVEIGRRAGLAVENARLYAELAEVSEAKSQFLSTMSHELRTPLNAIIGYASLLRDRVAGPLTEVQGEHISRILGAADHLLVLINEVLTLSRLEAGKERVDPSTFDLAALTHAVSEMVLPIADRNALRLTVEAAGPVVVRSDETKVRQILLNLLSNAIKFTDEGGISVRVAQDTHARIQVRDTGRGIADADLERIFDPFYQVSQGTTRSEGGTGLGLTVSRRLARLLGGDLEVASQPGAGSTFTLRLPLP